MSQPELFEATPLPVAPHTIVVTAGEHGHEYAVECPGLVPGRCRAWEECDRCPHDLEDLSPTVRAKLEDGEFVHGEQHLGWEDAWWVPTSRCIVATDEALDEAVKSAGLDSPGRWLATIDEAEDHWLALIPLGAA